MDRIFDARALAARYGLSVATLTDWRYKRTGPPWFKAGKKVFYHESDVLAWEAEQKREQAESA